MTDSSQENPENPENPSFILPIGLRNTTVNKVLKVLHPKHKIEVTSGIHTYQNFQLDRKSAHFNTCKKLTYPDRCECPDNDTCECRPIISKGPIPHNLKISYVGIVNKAVLYIAV